MFGDGGELTPTRRAASGSGASFPTTPVVILSRDAGTQCDQEPPIFLLANRRVWMVLMVRPKVGQFLDPGILPNKASSCGAHFKPRPFVSNNAELPPLVPRVSGLRPSFFRQDGIRLALRRAISHFSQGLTRSRIPFLCAAGPERLAAPDNCSIGMGGFRRNIPGGSFRHNGSVASRHARDVRCASYWQDLNFSRL